MARAPSLPPHVLAAQRLLALQAASTSYLDFVRLMYPDFDLPPFHVELIKALDLLERRALVVNGGAPVRNLLITMPPRHAKTTWGTINFPAYFLGRDPRRFVMSTSYNAILAKDFGRQVRNIISSPTFKDIFPSSTISRDKTASDVFRTNDGGAYYGIGLNGTTTGRAANLLIIDDPIKSRVEAESALIRDRVWDFYSGSLSNRRQPEADGTPAIQIVILTRWHPDDLAGRIMQTDEWHQGLWHHINFQALTEVPDTSPPQLQALWPERFPVAELLRQKAINERDFEALYQQRPIIRGGNLIKTEWLRHYDAPLDSYLSVVITADTAFKETQQSDFTAFLVAGLTADGDIHILDIQRGRWDFPEAKARLLALNTLWRGRGLRGIYVENRASGQSLLQELRRNSGIAVLPYEVGHTDKVTRVNISLPIIEGGRVYIPNPEPAAAGLAANSATPILRTPPAWVDDFIRETSQFPSSAHDDIVDAFVMAIDVLSRIGISANHIEQVFDLHRSLHSAPLTRDGKSLNAMLASGSAPRPPGW